MGLTAREVSTILGQLRVEVKNRQVLCGQKNGSSGRTRTYNPPVNRRRAAYSRWMAGRKKLKLRWLTVAETVSALYPISRCSCSEQCYPTPPVGVCNPHGTLRVGRDSERQLLRTVSFRSYILLSRIFRQSGCAARRSDPDLTPRGPAEQAGISARKFLLAQLLAQRTHIRAGAHFKRSDAN